MSKISDALRVIKTDLIPTTEEEKKIIEKDGVQAFRIQKLQSLIEQKRKLEERSFLAFSFESPLFTMTNEHQATDVKNPEEIEKYYHMRLTAAKMQKLVPFILCLSDENPLQKAFSLPSDNFNIQNFVEQILELYHSDPKEELSRSFKLDLLFLAENNEKIFEELIDLLPANYIPLILKIKCENPLWLAKDYRGSVTILSFLKNKYLVDKILKKIPCSSITDQYINGDTPLHLVIKYGSEDGALEILKKYPAEALKIVNDGCNETALHLAILNCMGKVTLEIIEKAPQDALNIQDCSFSEKKVGNTPLMIAIAQLFLVSEKKINSDIIIELIDKMSDEGLCLKNSFGGSALFLAIKIIGSKLKDVSNLGFDIVSKLVKRTHKKNLILTVFPLLYMNIADQKFNIAQLILENISDDDLAIQNPDSKDNTILHEFVNYGSRRSIFERLFLKIIQRMPPSGFRLKNREGKTALHLALSSDNSKYLLSSLEQLTEKMSLNDLIHQDKSGSTCFHLIAQLTENSLTTDLTLPIFNKFLDKIEFKISQIPLDLSYFSPNKPSQELALFLGNPTLTKQVLFQKKLFEILQIEDNKDVSVFQMYRTYCPLIIERIHEIAPEALALFDNIN